MKERRCPNCGGLVAPDAEWCGQCLSPLPREGGEPEPAPETPPTSPPTVEPRHATPPLPADVEPDAEPVPADEEEPGAEPAALAAREGEAERPLPSGEGEPIGEGDIFRMVGGRMVWTCPRCDANNPMESSVCERCGAAFSNLFREPTLRPAVAPGRAMVLSLVFPGVGHVAVGQVAEGVARAILFVWALGSLIGIAVVRGEGSAVGSAFVALYVLATFGLYGITALDAHRAAGGQPPLAPIRMLFYVASGVMAITIGVLLFSGTRIGGG